MAKQLYVKNENTGKKVRVLIPYTASWEYNANKLARSHAPPIFDCRRCGGPYCKGYVCPRCGCVTPERQ